MVAKRLSELRWLKETAGLYRQSLHRYTPFSLMIGLILSAAVFFAGYIWFCLENQLERWLFYIPFLVIYFFLFFWKTLAEKAVMEEPEKLFRRPLFAFYSLGLGLLFLLSLL
jgi:Ca2+/Na+ antiporter